LLVSCDKPQVGDDPGPEENTPPRVTRTERPPTVTKPEPREELRKKLRAAEKIESASRRAEALVEVAWNALELDPDLARQAFHQLPADSTGKMELIRHFALRMAEEDLEAAMAWAASLETEKESATAYGLIALAISEDDPEGAANLLSESGIAGEEFDVAAVQVLQRWAASAPADAAAWVRIFPAGDAREAGIGEIVSRWTDADFPAVLAWVESLEDETVRREAVHAVAVTLGEQPDEEVQEKLIQAVTTGNHPEIEDALKEISLEAADDEREPDE